MAVISTTLTEFADQGNTRTYVVDGHTALKPRLVIQRRKVVTGASTIAETGVKLVYGLVDPSGTPLASKATMDVSFRAPLAGTSGTDFDDQLSLLREIIASDEFAQALQAQTWVK